ncbi:29991_t:CDS:2, partial [Racocetra persica]
MNDNKILAMVHKTFNSEQVVTDPKEDNVLPTPPFEKLKNVLKKQTDLFGYFGDQDSQYLFE